jgi:hypothetical protein
MALTPAPSRQRVLTFLSPNVGDVLFYETKEGHRTNPPAYGTAHPDTTNWPNHKLAFIRQAEEGGAIYHWFYVADRATQNPYNWEFTKADIGGTKFDAVKRTYVTLRSAFTPATPAMGAAMPNTPTDLFTGSYVLAQRQQVRIGDKELDSLFVVDEQVYVKRCTLSVVQDDDETESVLKTESNLYYASEVVPDSGGATATALFADLTLSFWGTSATGVQREGRRISCEWYEITTRQLIPPNTPTAITGTAITAIPIRSYGTTNDFTWPAVFRVASGDLSAGNSIVFKAIPIKGGGYDNIIPRVQFSLPAYRGPTKMTVSEWWSSTALTQSNLPSIEIMLPKEVLHQGANFNLRMEPTLHGAFSLTDTIGSNDPRFEADNYSESYPATNYTDWPESLRVDVDQVPFRGGYRIRVVTAHRPSQYVAPPPPPPPPPP